MKELKAAIIFIAVLCLTVIVLFRTMNAMQSSNNATIVLAKEVCPIGVAIDQYGSCTVQGNLSRNFVFGEVEVTLADSTVLTFENKYLRGYIRDESSVVYSPFGRIFAGTVGLLIIIGGLWLAMGFPTKRSISKLKD